jgi:hypothetical protein
MVNVLYNCLLEIAQDIEKHYDSSIETSTE